MNNLDLIIAFGKQAHLSVQNLELKSTQIPVLFQTRDGIYIIKTRHPSAHPENRITALQFIINDIRNSLSVI